MITNIYKTIYFSFLIIFFLYYLREPYLNEDDYEKNPSLKPQKVEIDLGLTAFANARKYYDERRQASLKEKKTIEASSKALKNAEKKTKETLKEASKIASINKARKVYWYAHFANILLYLFLRY